MKNYEEMAQNVISKYADAKASAERKRKLVKRGVVTLGSLVVVAALSVCVWQFSLKGNNDIVNSNINNSSEIIYGGANVGAAGGETDGNGQTGKGEYDGDLNGYSSVPNITGALVDPENDPARVIFTVNNITGEIGSAKLNFSEDKYFSKTLDLAGLQKYFGTDYSNLKGIIPKGYEYSGVNLRKFYYEIESGKIAYDTAVFSYTKGEQAIRINVSRIGAPYDCVYKLKEETKSYINEVEVLMGGRYKEDSEAFEFVFAEFSKDGVKYRITFENPEGEDAPTMLYKLLYILTE